MKILVTLLSLVIMHGAVAETFDMPPPEFDLVGVMREVEAAREDTLLDIARRYGIGQEEILRANPDVDRWLPGAGARVTIPSRYILPGAPYTGLVLNLPEMRLYYFPDAKEGVPAQVQTYPISIGRMDWATPLGATKIVSKQKNPAWRPPESIRREHEEKGDPLPRVVPPGPDNPLGDYAMRLGIPGYLIHGTNKAFGVGMRVSHGCIRMLPEDIEVLFPQLPRGTPVQIINQPVKAGWYGGQLYLEVHPPLEEKEVSADELLEEALLALDVALLRRDIELDEAALDRALRDQNGFPVAVSIDS